MRSFLESGDTAVCFGCGACVQACPFGALKMLEDDEGFLYPAFDSRSCRDCGRCHEVCPTQKPLPFHGREKEAVFGGHIADAGLLKNSTSGGAFIALVNAWFSEGGERVAWGAVAHGLKVQHECARHISGAYAFMKSKYSQSNVGNAYEQIAAQLKDGISVLFSGTPCQIAGLYSFIGSKITGLPGGLLTVEVICEGVPSPLYIRKLIKRREEIEGSSLHSIDYRSKDGRRWDFQVMSFVFQNGHHVKVDRWFNPFWSVWLQHLMNRPSCYECPFACPERLADITLGDLWGVHLMCPELYNRNAGASLVLCSTECGEALFSKARAAMVGHEIDFDTVLRFQGPLRRPIGPEPRREAFIRDLRALEIDEIDRKWAKRPTIGFLLGKYIWGNRQKVALWRIANRVKRI